MSAVYLGRRSEPAPDGPNVVALKIVRYDVAKDARLVNMFLQEGKLIARLVHPNIVRTLEVGGDAEHDFIAMELLLGKTFSAIQDEVVARGLRLNADIAAWAAARTAEALHYAHELSDEHARPLGLVHRDVNPANVFATFDGEIKLIDFGLAKATAGEMVGSPMIAGKVSYLSPEQIMQMPLDRRSDIFSLGTTLWELLTGRRLFRRDTDIDTVRAVQLGPIPDVRSVAPDTPERLALIVRTALERNRDRRYPSAAHLARELDAFVLERRSSSELKTRIAELVDTLFPGEQRRQSNWLKPAISTSSSRSMKAVHPSSGVSIPPAAPSSSRLSWSPPPSSRASVPAPSPFSARPSIPVSAPRPSMPVSSHRPSVAPPSLRPSMPVSSQRPSMPPPLPRRSEGPATITAPPPSLGPLSSRSRPPRASIPLPSQVRGDSRPPTPNRPPNGSAPPPGAPPTECGAPTTPERKP